MARGVNKVILVGNLGNDPDVKYTQGGMAVCKISLATSSTRKDKDGNQVEKTEWHRVTLFGKLGEIAGEYLAKGRQVYIEGRLTYSESTGDDGTKRYFTDVIADDMQMLGGGGQGDDAGQGRSSSPRGAPARGGGGAGYGTRSTGARDAPAREPAASRAQNYDDVPFDDDIPF